MGLGLGLGLSTLPLSFAISSLFSNGEQGALYYFDSSFTGLYQDSAGTTPVTAVEQPVGLMLDRRFGLARGAELAPSLASSAGWTALVAGVTFNGSLNFAGSVAGGSLVGSITQNVAPGAYEIVYTIASITGSVSVGIAGANWPGTQRTAPGTYRDIINTTDGTVVSVISRGGGVTALVISALSVRALPGNHATQATAAARPVLSARKNLLTWTEDFTNTAWTKRGTGVVATGAIAPDGSATAFTLSGLDAVGAGDVYYGSFASVNAGANAVITPSVWVQRVSTTGKIHVSNPVNENLNGKWVVDLALLGTGWNQLSATHPAVTVATAFTAAANGNAGIHFLAETPGLSVRVWHPQLEQGATATRYQRVNTATDYDTVGFPLYLRGDGVDDYLLMPVAFTDGPSFVSSAFWADGTMATDQTIMAFRSTTSSNPIQAQLDLVSTSGNLRYAVRNDGGVAAIGQGSGKWVGAPVVGSGVFTGADTTTYANGSNIASIAGAPVTITVNRGTIFAGSGGSTTIASYLKGRIYGIVARNAVPTTAQRAATERFFANLAGVTLP